MPSPPPDEDLTPGPSGGGDPGARTIGGELNAALTRAIVRVHRKYLGRGPTKAQAFFRHNVVVVLLEDVMTTQERSLVARGQHGSVIRLRRELHDTMRADLIAAVEELTDALVIVLMSDTSAEPDMACEVFVMDRPIQARPAAADP